MARHYSEVNYSLTHWWVCARRDPQNNPNCGMVMPMGVTQCSGCMEPRLTGSVGLSAQGQVQCIFYTADVALYRDPIPLEGRMVKASEYLIRSHPIDWAALPAHLPCEMRSLLASAINHEAHYMSFIEEMLNRA